MLCDLDPIQRHHCQRDFSGDDKRTGDDYEVDQQSQQVDNISQGKETEVGLCGVSESRVTIHGV